MGLTIGLALALFSAVALNWGYFVQHGASNELHDFSVRHPLHALRALFTDTRWLSGYALGMGGWGLYVTALYFAPLSIVQAISAGGIGVLTLLVTFSGELSLSREEWVALYASLGGLLLVIISFLGGIPRHHRIGPRELLIWLGVLLVLAGVSWTVGSRALRPGAGLGLTAGFLFAAGDVSTKGATSGTGLFLVPVLLACTGLGFVALQLAFQRGTALATAGLSTLMNNAVPIVAGVLLFHELLPRGPWGALRATGFLLVVFGAVSLARTEQPVSGPGEPPPDPSLPDTSTPR
jgi:hypothetical protein